MFSLLETEKETFKDWTFSTLHTNKLIMFMDEVTFIKGMYCLCSAHFMDILSNI